MLTNKESVLHVKRKRGESIRITLCTTQMKRKTKSSTKRINAFVHRTTCGVRKCGGGCEATVDAVHKFINAQIFA